MPITHLQGASNSSGSAGVGTIAASFGAPVTSGDAVIVVFGYGGPGDLSAAPTITDDKSNSYTYVERAFQLGEYGLGVAYKLYITNTPSTITVTFPESHAFPSVIVDEYSNVKSLDTHVIASGNTGAGGPYDISSGSVLTAAADLVYGYGWANSGAVSAGSGFTATQQGGSFNNILAEYLLQSAAGPVATSFTGTAGQNYVAGLMALSPVLTLVADTALLTEDRVSALSDIMAALECTASSSATAVNRDSRPAIEFLSGSRRDD